MRTTMKAALAVAAAAAVALGTALSASADTGSTSGGDPKPTGYVDVADRQATDKMVMAQAWVAAVTPSSSKLATSATSSSARVLRYRELAAAYEQTYGKAAAVQGITLLGTDASAYSSGVPSQQPPATKTMATGSAGQATWYYCGPASAYNILAYKGFTSSRTNGAALSQAALATSAHMNTDATKLTTVWSNQYNNGINKWRSGSTSGFYVRTMLDATTSARSRFTAAFLYNSVANEPFAVSTLETYDTPGGGTPPRYNYHGNPTSTDGRGHWITARGYSGYGTTMQGKFADPMWNQANGVAQFFDTTNNGSLATFFNQFVAGRGIVW